MRERKVEVSYTDGSKETLSIPDPTPEEVAEEQARIWELIGEVMKGYDPTAP